MCNGGYLDADRLCEYGRIGRDQCDDDVGQGALAVDRGVRPEREIEQRRGEQIQEDVLRRRDVDHVDGRQQRPERDLV